MLIIEHLGKLSLHRQPSQTTERGERPKGSLQYFHVMSTTCQAEAPGDRDLAHLLLCLCCMKMQKKHWTQYGPLILAPDVRRAIHALCSIHRKHTQWMTMEDKAYFACAEGLRSAYTVGKAIGITRDDFMALLERVMMVADQIDRKEIN
jgi:hypothetical protein